MRILIAHDGSECADAALADLKRAGLPRNVEATVLSVADVFVPPPISCKAGEAFPAYETAGVRRAHEKAEAVLAETTKLARRVSEQVKAYFPEWKVDYQAIADSPAWGVIWKASELESDLIVVGSHGHSALGGRLILGSVSLRVLYEAKCSVRVARYNDKPADAPIRFVIGVDGSSYSSDSIKAVIKREWPKGTEVRLITVVDTVMPIAPDPSRPSVMKWIEVDEENDWNQVREIFEPLAAQLRSVGLNTSITVLKGNPKELLIAEAERWGADCIFVGAKGLRGFERMLLGSVSSSAAARAHCSVEVVRT